MLAAALLAASAEAGLTGCDDAPTAGDPVASGQPPPLPPPNSIPQCAPYQDNPNVYGFCLYKHAGGLPTAADMQEVCAKAGEWQDECRHAWVSGRMNADSGFATEALLEACGQNYDCTFELIDFRPAEDPLVQIQLCTQHTGPYGRDCAGHAAQRWWMTDPDEADVARVAGTMTPYPDRIGYWIGVNVQCYDKGSCEGDPHVVQSCQKSVDNFQRNPTRCPARSKNPLHPNLRPQDRAPTPGQHNPAGGARDPQRP